MSTINSYTLGAELSALTYNDGTTNVSFLYNRLGRQQQVTQGTLTNTFAYIDAGLLLGETYSGSALNGLRVTNLYDTALRRATNGLWNGASWLVQSRKPTERKPTGSHLHIPHAA